MSEAIIHEVTVELPKEKIKQINRLLAIDSLSDMSDEELRNAGANTHYNERIFTANFDNGCSITYDLCSGVHNYWDEILWVSADKSNEVEFESEFELGKAIEMVVYMEVYIVNIKEI